MSYQAFNLLSLHGTNVNKTISAIAIWGDTLFIGLPGRLKIFDVVYDKTNDSSRYSVKLKKEVKSFGKKIGQFCVVANLGLLIALVDGYIKLNTLSSLREMCVLKDSKGKNALKNVSLFALKKHGGSYRLAVAFKNKKVIYVMNFNFKSSEFFVTAEYNVTDTPRSINWSEEKLFVGFSKEYALLNKRGKVESSIKCPNSQILTTGLTIQNENVIKMHKRALTYDFNGRPTRTRSIDFAEDPKTLAYLFPYLVGSVGSFLEIKLVDQRASKQTSNPQVQTIDLDGIRLHSQPNFIDFDGKVIDDGIGIGYRENSLDDADDLLGQYRLFLVQKSQVFVLVMKRFDLQIQEITAYGNFKEALNLCDILESYPGKSERFHVSKKQIDSIHMEYGFHLFVHRSYKLALTHFSKTDIDPRCVLGLYGRDMFPQCTLPLPKKWGMGGENDKWYSNVDRERAFKQLADKDNREQALKSLKMYLLEKRDLGAVYIESVDTALLKTLLILDDAHLMTFLQTTKNYCNVALTETNLRKFGRFVELIEFYRSKSLHEKALRQLYFYANTKSEDNKLRGVEPTIKYLRNLKDKRLVAKYCKWTLRKNHLAGIEVFTHDECPFTVEEVLKFLDVNEIYLTEENILGDDEMIYDDDDEVLDKYDMIILILEMKIKFLKYLIERKNVIESEVHNLLIILFEKLIENCEKRSESLSDSKDVNSNIRNELLTKILIQKKSLRKFLKTSQHYVANKIISRFASNNLSKERAILLSRLNKHEEALHIYIHVLKNQKAAEKYCRRNYDPNDPEKKDIFLTLLKINLKPSKEIASAATGNSNQNSLESENKIEQIYVDESIKIMEKYFSKINLLKSMELLPNFIPIHRLKVLFINCLRIHIKEHRNQKIMRNLTYSELVQTRYDLTKENEKFVEVTSKQTCCKCKKRLGVSAVVRKCGGRLFHHICAKEFL